MFALIHQKTVHFDPNTDISILFSIKNSTVELKHSPKIICVKMNCIQFFLIFENPLCPCYSILNAWFSYSDFKINACILHRQKYFYTVFYHTVIVLTFLVKPLTFRSTLTFWSTFDQSCHHKIFHLKMVIYLIIESHS